MDIRLKFGSIFGAPVICPKLITINRFSLSVTWFCIEQMMLAASVQ